MNNLNLVDSHYISRFVSDNALPTYLSVVGHISINIVMHNIKLIAMIDTGCSNSIIFINTINKLNLNNLITGSNIFNIKFYIDGNEFESKFKISEPHMIFRCDLILGFDFLTYAKINIDFINNVIWCPNFCSIISYNLLCEINENSDDFTQYVGNKKEINIIKNIIDNKNNIQNYFDNINSHISFNMIWINVNLNGNKIAAMIDTGSNINIISSDIIDKLKLNYMVDYNIVFKQQLIDRSVISSGYIHCANFLINEYSFQSPFSICDELPVNMLFGNTFLTDNNVFLDIANRKIIFNETLSIDF